MRRLSVLPVLLVVAGVGWLGGGVPIPHVQAVQGATRAVEGLGEEPEYVGLAAEWTVQQAVEVQRVAEENARLQAEADAAAAELAAQQARIASRPSPAAVSTPVTASPGCTGSYVIPQELVFRESRCDPNAVNASSGAYGLYQIMPMHWNPGGVCDDLAARRSDVQAQNECAWRLSNGGTNLDPWRL